MTDDEKAQIIRQTWQHSGWQWRHDRGDTMYAVPYPPPKFVVSRKPVDPTADREFKPVRFRRMVTWDGLVIFGSYDGLEIQVGTAPPLARNTRA
jgi:hypothetical protein